MGSAAHTLDAEPRCAYCNGGEQPFDLDRDGELVCREGTGCNRSMKAPRRAPVDRTRVARLAPAPAPKRSRDVCACGREVDGRAEGWRELVGFTLLAFCPSCGVSP